MPQQVERRTITESVKLEAREDKAPVIQGYAALFDVEANIGGWFMESIARGAFKSSLESNQRVVSLFNHDPNYVLGSTSGGTLRVTEDEKGLWMECEPPDTQVGRDVVEYIRRGDVQGQSFMFEIRKQEWTFAKDSSEMDRRIITEIVLHECGPVLFPAYSETSVGLRSAEESYKLARSEWEKAKEPDAPIVITYDPSIFELKVRCLRAQR